MMTDKAIDTRRVLARGYERLGIGNIPYRMSSKVSIIMVFVEVSKLPRLFSWFQNQDGKPLKQIVLFILGKMHFGIGG